MHFKYHYIGTPLSRDSDFFLFPKAVESDMKTPIQKRIPDNYGVQERMKSFQKGVDGFSVETAGSGKHPFSPSSDSLTDAWAPTVHKLYHNQAFLDYVMHSSFAYRQFNSNFTCGDPMILPYEPIQSRNRGTVGHNVRLPRAWQVLDVYTSLTPPEYGAGAPNETLLSVHLFHPAINL
ncbi:hypothetical protein AVEN_152139-1 [Araneus ventricosus]|uniref:Uncharacterized protein n=1 Tax=Araneus ventricosus TaxID=182803 RepID=A0A4Y2MW44_ARAVE|nr:hypothetical protein AVEN_152139-1 [Araneus ventricosus]